MHELSLAAGVLQLVEDAAQRERFQQVRRLTLQAGALAGVELRALRFALEALAPGTALEGADLVIEQAPGQAWCLQCAATVAIESRTDACPGCGGYQLQPTGGTELKVLDLLVLD
jgi:hydrogenase nickel incorporation protein HypA/HybF